MAFWTFGPTDVLDARVFRKQAFLCEEIEYSAAERELDIGTAFVPAANVFHCTRKIETHEWQRQTFKSYRTLAVLLAT